MQDEKQFEQLILQYNQLKNGAEEIARMIKAEDFDAAITMIKSREELFLNCKCMRKYLDLTQVQEKELEVLLDEIRTLEITNIKMLEKGMEEVQTELKRTQQSQKLRQAYDIGAENSGNIVNYHQ